MIASSVRLRRVEPGSYLVPDTDLIVLAHFNDWAVWPRGKAVNEPLVRRSTLRLCRAWLDQHPELLGDS